MKKENFSIEEKIILFRKECEDLISNSGLTISIISFIIDEISESLHKEKYNFQKSIISDLQEKIKNEKKQKEKEEIKKEVNFDEATGITVEDVYL